MGRPYKDRTRQRHREREAMYEDRGEAGAAPGQGGAASPAATGSREAARSQLPRTSTKSQTRGTRTSDSGLRAHFCCFEPLSFVVICSSSPGNVHHLQIQVHVNPCFRFQNLSL